MTQSNGNQPDRLDRIEATLDRLAAQSEVTRVQLESGINDVVGMIGTLAQMQADQGQRIDDLATLVGTVARGQEEHGRQIEEQGRRIEQLVSEAAQDRRQAAEDRQEMRTAVTQINEAIQALLAANQRQERINDFLLRERGLN